MITDRILAKVANEPNLANFQLLEKAAMIALNDIPEKLEVLGDDVVIHEFHVLENYILALEKTLENLLESVNA